MTREMAFRAEKGMITTRVADSEILSLKIEQLTVVLYTKILFLKRHKLSLALDATNKGHFLMKPEQSV